MSRARVVSLVAPFVLLTSACGSGKDYSAPADLASALACTDYQPQPQAAVAAQVGTCMLAGEQVSVLVADSADKRDAAVETSRRLQFGFGVPVGGAVTGGRWAVLTESRKVAEQAQVKVGGKLS